MKFTKKDLKTGLIVQTRNREIYLVVEDTLLSVKMHTLLHQYNEDLKAYSCPPLDIMTVWKPKYIIGLEFLTAEIPKDSELLFEREE